MQTNRVETSGVGLRRVRRRPVRALPTFGRALTLLRVAPFRAAPLWLALLALASSAARAYGPLGHRIAGLAAEPLLCARARDEIRLLAEDTSLDELGLWADRIRDYPQYAGSAPWHYVNVPDDASLDEHVAPPAGDILSAIAGFTEILADDSRPRAERRDALRFLVHFIVDLHQPLHVGRAEDRGGNTIELEVRGERTNLHRLWDTGAVALGGVSVDAYARGLLARAGPVAGGGELAVGNEADVGSGELPAGTGAVAGGGGSDGIGAPLSWARESLALRPDVYSFGTSGRIGEAYLRRAERITEERLAFAAWRLAGTLNGLFC